MRYPEAGPKAYRWLGPGVAATSDPRQQFTCGAAMVWGACCAATRCSATAEPNSARASVALALFATAARWPAMTSGTAPRANGAATRVAARDVCIRMEAAVDIGTNLTR